MTTNTSIPQMIDTKTLGARLGVSRQTIVNLRRAGKIPQPIKIGVNRIGWMESTINEWLENGGVAQ